MNTFEDNGPRGLYYNTCYNLNWFNKLACLSLSVISTSLTFSTNGCDERTSLLITAVKSFIVPVQGSWFVKTSLESYTLGFVGQGSIP